MNLVTATFLTQALISLSMGMLNSASKPYGDSAIAAMGITLRVSALVLFVVIGYNQGFQPIASFNYGAKNFERLKEAIKISIKRISIFSVVTTLLLWIFAKQAIVVFSNDPEVIEIGAKALRFSTLMFPLLGYQQLYAILFQALGKGKEALITSISRQGIFFVPAIIILPKLFGLDGVLLTQAVSDFFTILLTVVLASKLKKNLKEEEKEAALTGEVALG
ncbi:MATE family efflux transporter [Clostridium sp. B9]|uniref:MATE family efflux transporter n=1 Tax=Clostridium sp. B9 TaxID=3423224 RepID=UPI003D2F037B